MSAQEQTETKKAAEKPEPTLEEVEEQIARVQKSIDIKTVQFEAEKVKLEQEIADLYQEKFEKDFMEAPKIDEPWTHEVFILQGIDAVYGDVRDEECETLEQAWIKAKEYCTEPQLAAAWDKNHKRIWFKKLLDSRPFSRAPNVSLFMYGEKHK